MFKCICILLLLWLLIRPFRSPSRKSSSRTTARRDTTRPSQPEGTTTLTRIEEPKKKVVDASTAETAHFEEVE